MILVTAAVIRALSTKEKPELVPHLVAAMNEFFPVFEITTEKRVEHFLAQSAHESDGFHTLEEYASGNAYDTRVDLGNTPQKDGDGAFFKGHGIFQTTGKTNHLRVQRRMKDFGIDVDLMKNPRLLCEPRLAVLSACIYWQDKKLNALADKDDLKAITRKINGGENGIEDRRRYLDKARVLIKETKATAPDDPFVNPTSPPELIKTLQRILADKNYQPGRVDGLWGNSTRDALMSMKADNALDVSVEGILLSQAKASGPRVLAARVDATVADLRADGSQTVAGADKVQMVAGVATVGAPALGLLGKAEETSGTVSRILAVFEPFQGMLPWITDHLWYILPGAGVVAIYLAHRAKLKRLEEFKTGKMG